MKLCKFMLYEILPDMLQMKIESRPKSSAFFLSFTAVLKSPKAHALRFL
jgi:hypothetical protein